MDEGIKIGLMIVGGIAGKMGLNYVTNKLLVNKVYKPMFDKIDEVLMNTVYGDGYEDKSEDIRVECEVVA